LASVSTLPRGPPAASMTNSDSDVALQSYHIFSTITQHRGTEEAGQVSLA
jgi:hypothetical protein